MKALSGFGEQKFLFKTGSQQCSGQGLNSLESYYCQFK
jgi:hypothetical protein